MNLTAGIAIYLIVWWLVFFTMLPIGVRSQAEEGGIEGQGRDPGAPVRPMLWRKVAAATVLGAVIWGAVYWIVVKQPFSYDDIPFMPKFQDWPGAQSAPIEAPQDHDMK